MGTLTVIVGKGKVDVIEEILDRYNCCYQKVELGKKGKVLFTAEGGFFLAEECWLNGAKSVKWNCRHKREVTG